MSSNEIEVDPSNLESNSIPLQAENIISQATKSAGNASNTVTINNIQLNTSITKEIERSMINAITSTKKAANVDKIEQITDKSLTVMTAPIDKKDKNNVCDSIVEVDYGRRKTAASSHLQVDGDPVIHIRHISNPENIEILKYIISMFSIVIY